MSRRRRHYPDTLSERVADSFLQVDLANALNELSSSERDYVLDMIERQDDDPTPERTRQVLRRVLSRVRLHPIHQARLLAYIGDPDRPVDEPGKCPVCFRNLGRREPGKAGRPPKYCSSRCKRQAHHTRTRSRAANRLDLPNSSAG